MVGKWEHTWLYHANIPMRQSAMQLCTAWRKGHCPKVLLWIMEEFFYISQQLTDEDCNGRIVLGYELMLEAEHRFRIKQGRGASDATNPPCIPLVTAPPYSQETLDCVTWSNPDSRMLECLVWSIYDGIVTPGPTPRLVGPESYNQVLRCLATKAFRGLQVHCSARTSAQFDEPPPPRVQSVVLMLPPWREGAKKVEITDTASPKDEDIEEGTMGGVQ